MHVIDSPGIRGAARKQTPQICDRSCSESWELDSVVAGRVGGGVGRV